MTPDKLYSEAVKSTNVEALEYQNGHAPDVDWQDIEEDSESPISYTKWPEPLGPAAYYGIIGQITNTIAPHTEADPAAILFQALICIGNILGRTAHFTVEASNHYCNEFAVIVGATAKGRKGSSFSQIKKILRPVDPDWAKKRVLSGLSSGEGLIFNVRDEVREEKEKKGRREIVQTDPGESDKRLLVVEEEFSAAIRAMSREGNTLSQVIRQAWDSPDQLSPMTKNNRITASCPHVSIIGHITKDELLRSLKSVENTNGGTNRYLWCCARRSKLLPFGSTIHYDVTGPISHYISAVIKSAKDRPTHIDFDSEAREAWEAAYEELGRIPGGQIGSILSRAEAHVRRIATIYAVLDQWNYVNADHLAAAMEVWRYSRDSVNWIFDGHARIENLQLSIRDKILAFIASRPEGTKRRDIALKIGGRINAATIEFHLSELLTNGEVVAKSEKRSRQSCDYYYKA